jgi:hypothetical protein
MSAAAIIATCAKRGITLTPDGDDIEVEGAPLTPRLRARLVAHKAEVLSVLQRLDGMRQHPHPIPCAKDRREAPGGPGRCFSCGDPLDAPSHAVGRCALCWQAVELYYRAHPPIEDHDTFRV